MRDRIRDDLGKGKEVLRTLTASVILANGTVIVHVGRVPAPIRVRRILVGSAIATDLTSFDVIALAAGSDLDTAVATGNKLITSLTAIADKKMNAQALTALADSVPPDYDIVVVGVHSAAVPTGPVNVQVEYDLIGTTYGSYDAGDTSQATYA